MSSALISFIAGLVLLPVAAEILVRGSVGLARRAGISPLLVGLTVVSFGTSAPELVVCVKAALAGSSGLVYGNIVGSNIANILLILGAAALLKPIACERGPFLRDSFVMVAATVVLVGVMLSGALVFWQGAVMLTALIGYMVYSYRRETAGADVPEAEAHLEEVEELDTFRAMSVPLIIALVIGGLAGVVWGADLLVTGGVELARMVGISEEVIGLTLVAVGTSLPELATSVVAALRGHSDVALGNVVGSNIFNILGILGVTGMVATVPASAQILSFDLWVMVATSVLLVPLMLTGNRLSRLEGVSFLAIYAVYIGVVFVGVETLV